MNGYGNGERAALDAALSRVGVDLSLEKKELLLEHLVLLFEKNESLNLTRLDSFEDAIANHVEDSLSVYDEFVHSQGEFCDIGTGGGFPGIPLGIASGRDGVLLDSIKKKATAVQGFIDALGLGASLRAVGARSEEFAQEEGDSRFDTVVARAVSSLPVVMELATPLLRYGGRLVAMRGRETAEQLAAGRIAAEKLGLKQVSSREFAVGPDKAFRSVYVYERVSEPSVKVPRRPGMAQKRPLG